MQSGLANDIRVVPAALAIGQIVIFDRPVQPASRGGGAPATAQELIKAIAERRDRSAFVALFEMFGPRVKSFLMRQGADPETAEELMQDVMLTVWRRVEQYDPDKAAVSTWVFTIARNRRIDCFRRERRPEFDPQDPAFVPEQEKPADQIYDAERRNERLHAAVTQLPPEQEHLLRLAYFDDKSHSTIADELALPLGTVKSRLRLAMSKLRTTLEAQE